jgi:hypothetical protein
MQTGDMPLDTESMNVDEVYAYLMQNSVVHLRMYLEGDDRSTEPPYRALAVHEPDVDTVFPLQLVVVDTRTSTISSTTTPNTLWLHARDIETYNRPLHGKLRHFIHGKTAVEVERTADHPLQFISIVHNDHFIEGHEMTRWGRPTVRISEHVVATWVWKPVPELRRILGDVKTGLLSQLFVPNGGQNDTDVLCVLLAETIALASSQDKLEHMVNTMRSRAMPLAGGGDDDDGASARRFRRQQTDVVRRQREDTAARIHENATRMQARSLRDVQPIHVNDIVRLAVLHVRDDRRGYTSGAHARARRYRFVKGRQDHVWTDRLFKVVHYTIRDGDHVFMVEPWDRSRAVCSDGVKHHNMYLGDPEKRNQHYEDTPEGNAQWEKAHRNPTSHERCGICVGEQNPRMHWNVARIQDTPVFYPRYLVRKVNRDVDPVPPHRTPRLPSMLRVAQHRPSAEPCDVSTTTSHTWVSSIDYSSLMGTGREYHNNQR